MKKLFIAFFYYTRKERLGIITLCLIALLMLFIPNLFPLFSSRQKVDFSAFQKELARLEMEGDRIQNKQLLGTLFKFDPNTASLEDLNRLGLNSKTAQTIINYRKKGGLFKKPIDLRKIYSLKEEEYLRLKDYIDIPVEEENRIAKIRMDEGQQQLQALFPFNPNEASEEDLSRLGLKPKVIRTLINFRGKGGQFYHKEDLKKIYGLSDYTYQKLEPYIDIPEKTSADKSEVVLAGIPTAIPSSYEKVPIVVDINKASLEDWQKLRGIGPGYARRILGFRDKLGGFVNVEQVRETYHLPDSTFQNIRPFLKSSPVFRPLLINKMTAEQLKDHPYLNWKHANAIVNYREQHGPFSQLEDVHQLYALPKEVVEKIAPYLKFE